jgi:hypothetical protein
MGGSLGGLDAYICLGRFISTALTASRFFISLCEHLTT